MTTEDVHPISFKDVCRFCLSGEQCVPLFINAIFNEELIDAIEYLVPKIDLNDGLPNAICQSCYQILVDYARFEAKASETYVYLLATLSTALQESSPDDGKDPTDLNEETLCSLDFETVENGGEAGYAVQDEDGMLSRDELADELEPSEEFTETLEEPQQAKANEIPMPQQPQEAEDEQDGGKKRAAKKECPLCGKLVWQLSKHMPLHTGVKQFRCEYCDKRFAYDTSLQKHLKIHRDIRNYHCQHCDQTFCDRSSLRYHEAKHRGERNFQCTECSSSFYTTSQLRQHLDLAHQARSYRCGRCGKVFHIKHHLEDHMLSHSDERPFICTVCNKAFKRARHLREHCKRLSHDSSG